MASDGAPQGPLDDLGKRIGEARRTQTPESPQSRPPSGLGLALRMSSELVAAVVVGLVLGFGFDAVFGTRPAGLLVFLALGICAGFYNVFRLAGQMSKPPDAR
jgi:ATP synthase protein I